MRSIVLPQFALALVSLVAVGCTSTVVSTGSAAGSDAGMPAEAGGDGAAPDTAPPSTADSGADTAAPDAGAEAAPDDASADASPTLPFQPSNVTMDSVTALAAMAQAEDVEASCTIQTIAANLGAGCLTSPIVTTTETLSGGQTQTIALVVVQSLKIGNTGSILVEGDLPLVIVSLGDVTLDSGSSIQANSISALDYVGPGGAAEQGNESMKGLGAGGGPAGSTTTYIGAGGGSFCGLGGPGGGSTAETPVYGSADVRPLLGGSSGGSGTGDPGGSGAGGGGIQIVAMGTLTVSSTAYITVGGQGARSCIGGACSAGGSGGALLLEATTVKIAGILAANGGAGGSGQAAGSDGLPLSNGTAPTAAPGGVAAAGSAAAGGNGSAGPTAAGAKGTAGSATIIPGGGGGGAGWIRINSGAGAATLTGATLSPDATTSCTVQGKTRTIAQGP